MIISVHTPKAAGTSLSASFVDSYGKERVLLDYTDDPADVRSQFHLDPDYVRCRRIDAPRGVDVVHGHFHPSRYAHIADAQFVTFLRSGGELDFNLSLLANAAAQRESAARVFPCP